ncbi:phospholipase D family protein [Bacillus infantis]|uniref:phospholipase D n=1 Tax=Bacillus infantis TaxID=324767 RepID=A0A5D4RBM3_9BACI|nr:phospholipase D family protein [Bacillus infantis]TYS47949.1 phospholipase [Bacillus infantis]
MGPLKEKKIWVPAVVLLLIVYSVTVIYHTNKKLPEGLSYEGKVHQVDDLQLLTDLSYEDKKGKRQHEQEIFERMQEAIEEAEEYIVMDMFLYSGYYDKEEKFPPLSQNITDRLIMKKKQNPEMPIIVITDKINTTYGSHKAPELEELKKNGIEVVMTELEPLRDSNPLYSGFWRMFLQWFGQDGKGWLPNPLANTAPDVTARSYLDLLNIKANHRKVFVSEKTAIVSSGNPHDASGYHSNIAFEGSGSFIEDLLQTEQAVIDYSGYDIQLPKYQQQDAEEGGPVSLQVLTEGKILKHIVQEIDESRKGDIIWLGMFYLADRDVIGGLEEAADRGVQVNLVFDPNQNAFGSEKTGLPNIPVASELEKLGKENISIRWYNTDEEQYHPKLMFIHKKTDSVLIGGSANFTKRNLDDLNLETDLKIAAPNDTPVMEDADAYFKRIWENEDGIYTLDYATQEELPVFRYIVYSLQKMLGFTTY